MQFHVIDDEQYICDLMVAMFSVLDHSATAFNSPDQYLKHVHSAEFEAPVAVITDVDMPGMNGYEMMERVRRDYPNQKFIVITGSPDISHPIIYDACMFFRKPIRMETLKKAIEAITRCHSNGRDCNICSDLEDVNQFPVDWKCRQCPLAA